MSLQIQYGREATKASLMKPTNEVRAASNPNSEKKLRGRNVSNKPESFAWKGNGTGSHVMALSPAHLESVGGLLCSCVGAKSYQLGMVAYAWNPSTLERRKWDQEPKASIGYRVSARLASTTLDFTGYQCRGWGDGKAKLVWYDDVTVLILMFEGWVGQNHMFP